MRSLTTLLLAAAAAAVIAPAHAASATRPATIVRLTAAASDQLVVEDLKSTNGTLVNGKPVDRSVLKTGDVLTVGRVEFRILPG